MTRAPDPKKFCDPGHRFSGHFFVTRAMARDFLTRATALGLWHEIQNRLKYKWFDVVFHTDSDSPTFQQKYVIKNKHIDNR
jgi:hypothetical protein